FVYILPTFLFKRHPAINDFLRAAQNSAGDRLLSAGSRLFAFICIFHNSCLVRSDFVDLSIFHIQYICEALLKLVSSRGVNWNNAAWLHGFDELFYILRKNVAASVIRYKFTASFF